MKPTFLNFNFLPLIWVLFLIAFSACWLYVSYRIYKKNPKAAFWLVCSLSIILTYFSYVNLVNKAFTLDGDFESTFEQVITRSKWPFLVDLVSLENGQFIQLEVSPGFVQSMMSVIALKSGMPAYVFDLDGNLVDYTVDTNDDPRYQKKWQHYDNWERITLEKAKSLIKQSR